MSSIAFRTIEGRVAFVKEINFRQSLKLFLVLLRMCNYCYLVIYIQHYFVIFFFFDVPEKYNSERTQHNWHLKKTMPIFRNRREIEKEKSDCRNPQCISCSG